MPIHNAFGVQLTVIAKATRPEGGSPVFQVPLNPFRVTIQPVEPALEHTILRLILPAGYDDSTPKEAMAWTSWR